MRTFLFVGLLVAATACGGNAAEVGGSSPPDGANTSSTAKVEIHVRASTAPVAHERGLAGQTPSDQKIAIRKLTLLTSEADPAPLVVFALPTAVDAGLNDMDDTIIATVPAASLRAGNYTIARVGISHVRYRVAATMHAAGQTVAGNFSNMQVLSDHAQVDGKPYMKGHYRFTFEAFGSPLATQEGEEGPLPIERDGSGITLDTSGAESSYVFPISLPVQPNIAGNVKLTFEINTHDNFRWQDESTAGYASDVFDVTPTTYEPVRSFGASSFRLVAEFSAPAQDADATSYTCPAAGTINCMPVVPPERQALCRRPYAAWIAKNCPGVRFSH